MITRPLVHPASLSVGEARTALADDHVHLLLLVAEGRLLGTLTRADLPPAYDDHAPALGLSRIEGRTVCPDDDVEQVRLDLLAAGERRRAVVDADGRLVGLLCLKRSGRGFCTDDGVAARAAERAGDS